MKLETQIKFVKTVLKNDPSSTNEELIYYFTQGMNFELNLVKELLLLRNFYLKKGFGNGKFNR